MVAPLVDLMADGEKLLLRFKSKVSKPKEMQKALKVEGKSVIISLFVLKKVTFQ